MMSVTIVHNIDFAIKTVMIHFFLFNALTDLAFRMCAYADLVNLKCTRMSWRNPFNVSANSLEGFLVIDKYVPRCCVQLSI